MPATRGRKRLPRYCLEHPPGDMAFATYRASGHASVLSTGNSDIVLTQAEALPRSSLLLHGHRAVASSPSKADAASLLTALGSLASAGPALNGSRTAVFQAVNEFGVSATIHALVMATLASLVNNLTLFSPRLLLWSAPARCTRSDMTCFFAALPSVMDLYRIPGKKQSTQRQNFEVRHGTPCAHTAYSRTHTWHISARSPPARVRTHDTLVPPHPQHSTASVVLGKPSFLANNPASIWYTYEAPHPSINVGSGQSFYPEHSIQCMEPSPGHLAWIAVSIWCAGRPA